MTDGNADYLLIIDIKNLFSFSTFWYNKYNFGLFNY